MSSTYRFCAALSLALLAVGCEEAEQAETTPVTESQPTVVESQPTLADAQPSAPEPCPDDGLRLAVTGICEGRAINYLDPGLNLITEAPEGCEWVMNDMAFAGEDQAILYRALRCNGVTTTLDFRGGAQSAALGYVVSALAGGDETIQSIEPVRIFGDGDRDPKTVIDWLKTGIEDEAERATCELRPAGIDSWPSDAMVLAPTAEARALLPQDEPIQACGDYGLDEDAQTFFRFAQGWAWYFDLGQDTMDFDPASILVLRRTADGWEAIPPEGVPLPPMPQ